MCSVCSSWSRDHRVLVVRSWPARRVLTIADTCTQACTHAHVCTQIFSRTHTCTALNTLTHTNTHIHTCTCSHSPKHTITYYSLKTHSHSYVRTHALVHTDICTHTFVHSHSCTHTPLVHTTHSLMHSFTRPGNFPAMWPCLHSIRVRCGFARLIPVSTRMHAPPMDPFAFICIHIRSYVSIFNPSRIIIVMTHFMF